MFKLFCYLILFTVNENTEITRFERRMKFLSTFMLKISQTSLPRRNFTTTHFLSKQIKLVLYTKEDCSLCDEAKDIIEDLYPNKFEIEEVDITKNNRELFRKFKLDIPVFYYNGEFLMMHRVDKKALEKVINEN